MKNLDALKSTGLSLNELNNPPENVEISNKLVELIKQTIKDTYQMQVILWTSKKSWIMLKKTLLCIVNTSQKI